MAIYGFSWSIPNLFGVVIAGLIMDYIGPNWVWYIAGILSLIAIVGFLLLQGAVKARFLKEKELLSEEAQ